MFLVTWAVQSSNPGLPGLYPDYQQPHAWSMFPDPLWQSILIAKEPVSPRLSASERKCGGSEKQLLRYQRSLRVSALTGFL